MKTNILYANLYLDYFNNYLTVDCFAENLNISPNKARKVLAIGRASHQDKFGHH